MEVKTHAQSAFAFTNSQPRYNSYIEQSELRASDILSSNMSASSNGGEYCERSVSNAAMKVQKVYRSYRTRRMLADSAVVAEVLWWQAINYARLNHSTISFFNYMKPETASSRWNRISLNASKIDPRHRYGHNLHIYYEEWCKTDSGQPFFFWLDLGDGKKVDLKECPRSKLQKQSIKYLGPQEREHYEYIVAEGRIVHAKTGNILDTTKGLPGAKWIFVMSTSKRLYAGEKKKGMFHHSSFLAGGATSAAGRLVVEDGRVMIGKANEAYESYDDGMSLESGSAYECSALSDSASQVDPKEEEESLPLESAGNLVAQKSRYNRSLSGGLEIPIADMPKTAILRRRHSEKSTKSYQLEHQLSVSWSTGAGPRIGCVADFPAELRWQALEMTNLSPRPCSV